MDAFSDPDFLLDEREAAGERPRRQPALKLPPGITWRAHSDQIGHLLPARGTRYLCNRMAIAERFAWPVRGRCAVCVAVLEEGRV